MTFALKNNSWDVAPWKGAGSSGLAMYHQLYGSLLASQEFGTPLDEMQLEMAKSVAFSDDNLTATIELYDYIVDSKGNTITASDVVFSYNMAPTVNGLFAHVDYLESIIATGTYTVEMKVGSAGAGIWENILAYCPVVSQSWYEGASNEEKSNNPATTGAYRVASNSAGTSCTFEAIEDFWQIDELRNVYQLANVKTINYICIAEDVMRTIALENGEIDACIILNTDFSKFEGNSDYNYFKFQQTNPSNLVFNCSEGSIFADVAMRKAILYAIDFDQVMAAADNIPGVAGVRGHDVAPPGCSDYDEAWDAEAYYEYNVELAKQYLAEAGYSENSGLKIHYMTKNQASQKSAATVIQSYLAAIGIELVIDAYDQALQTAYLSEPDQWDMTVINTSSTAGYVTDVWSYLFGPYGDYGTIGAIQNDAELTRLLDDAINIHDAASINAFRDYYMEQAYAINMWNQEGYIVTQSGITGIQFDFLVNPALNATTFSSDYSSVVR